MYYSTPPRGWKSGEGWNIGIAESHDLELLKVRTEYTLPDFQTNLLRQTENPVSGTVVKSGHPHLFTDLDGRTYLFYQGNNNNGKTWQITNEEVVWKHGKPVLK